MYIWVGVCIQIYQQSIERKLNHSHNLRMCTSACVCVEREYVILFVLMESLLHDREAVKRPRSSDLGSTSTTNKQSRVYQHTEKSKHKWLEAGDRAHKIGHTYTHIHMCMYLYFYILSYIINLLLLRMLSCDDCFALNLTASKAIKLKVCVCRFKYRAHILRFGGMFIWLVCVCIQRRDCICLVSTPIWSTISGQLLITFFTFFTFLY